MIINGRTYETVPLNFNTICKMEELGAPVTSIGENLFSVVRAYVSLCMKVSLNRAGEELEKHLIGGGDLKEIVEVFNGEAEESGFFLALRKVANVEEADEIIAKNLKLVQEERARERADLGDK